jgi:hypothetical protein
VLIYPLWLAQVALFAGGWLGPWRDAPELKNTGRLPRPARMLLSLSLVLAALILWLADVGKIEVYSQWVALGMVASFVGDLIMARLVRLSVVPNRLIGGMVAFGIAHGLYITAYVRTMQTISALEPYARFDAGLRIGLVGYGLITLLGWWFLIRNPQKGMVINVGALVYGLWISVMASFAFALALGLGGGFWLAALGGLLFVCSDVIVGITDIHGNSLKNANDWVWLTYVAGQMGIIYASIVG